MNNMFQINGHESWDQSPPSLRQIGKEAPMVLPGGRSEALERVANTVSSPISANA